MIDSQIKEREILEHLKLGQLRYRIFCRQMRKCWNNMEFVIRILDLDILV